MMKKATMIMKRLSMAALSLAVSTLAYGQTTQKLSANKTNEYGLLYTLPLTEIDVTIEAECTVETPGEFALYAGKYLSLTPITENTRHWTLKRVVINTHGVADLSERYLVQFKSGSTPYMVINEANFPLGINTEERYEAPKTALPTAVDARPTILESPAAKSAVTEEMLRSTSTAKRAELAAARIIELRQNRSDVISGQAESMPTDGKAMQLALDNIKLQEDVLTAMFTGTRQTFTNVATFSVRPDSLDSQRLVIARLSVTEGLVDADNLSGAPIYLNINVTERGKLPVNERGEVKKFPKGGLAYRVAGRADVAVEYDGRRVAQSSIPLAQAGVVFGLDPGLFTDKKAPAKVVFNPATGAIVELSTISPLQ